MGNLIKNFLCHKEKGILKRNHQEKDGKSEMHAELSLEKEIRSWHILSKTTSPGSLPRLSCEAKQLHPLRPSQNLSV